MNALAMIAGAGAGAGSTATIAKASSTVRGTDFLEYRFMTGMVMHKKLDVIAKRVKPNMKQATK